MSLAQHTESDIYLEGFLASMQQACERLVAKCHAKGEDEPEYREAYIKMAEAFVPPSLKNSPYGTIQPLTVVADALLFMRMTDWENFYRGAVEFKKRAPKYPERGREEEDARGVMLMALKYHIDGLTHGS